MKLNLINDYIGSVEHTHKSSHQRSAFTNRDRQHNEWKFIHDQSGRKSKLRNSLQVKTNCTFNRLNG